MDFTPTYMILGMVTVFVLSQITSALLRRWTEKNAPITAQDAKEIANEVYTQRMSSAVRREEFIELKARLERGEDRHGDLKVMIEGIQTTMRGIEVEIHRLALLVAETRGKRGSDPDVRGVDNGELHR